MLGRYTLTMDSILAPPPLPFCNLDAYPPEHGAVCVRQADSPQEAAYFRPLWANMPIALVPHSHHSLALRRDSMTDLPCAGDARACILMWTHSGAAPRAHYARILRAPLPHRARCGTRCRIATLPYAPRTHACATSCCLPLRFCLFSRACPHAPSPQSSAAELYYSLPHRHLYSLSSASPFFLALRLSAAAMQRYHARCFLSASSKRWAPAAVAGADGQQAITPSI